MSENVFKDLDLDVYHEIKAERRRQEEKGYTVEHDDDHVMGEIGRAAAYYALIAATLALPHPTVLTPSERYALAHAADVAWPWSPLERMPEVTPRENLIKAAALIVAEIERLDRLEARKEAS